ncbi:O-methyl transferase [Cladorrhinum sp. PSN259]|nr:O-methyl transferase [Cladorrhinum sp. PSN259]
MEATLAQIKKFADEASPESRQPIILALNKLITSLETPDNSVQRIGAFILQTSAALIGVDLNIFKILSEASDAVTLDELVAQTKAEKQLLVRLLRYLAAIGLVDQVSKEEYKANHGTRNFNAPVTNGALRHYFYTCAPEYLALPDHLKSTGYKNPQDDTHTAWHDAFKTDKGPFAWFADHPDNAAYFNELMAKRRTPDLSWLSVYPVQDEAKDWPADKPLYVNVGGSIGHQCAQFRQKYPAASLPGRVILQDLPYAIAAALPTPRDPSSSGRPSLTRSD